MKAEGEPNSEIGALPPLPWPPEVGWGQDENYRKSKKHSEKTATHQSIFYSIKVFSWKLYSGSFLRKKKLPPLMEAGPAEKARANLMLWLTRFEEIHVSAGGEITLGPPINHPARMNLAALQDIREQFIAMAPNGEFEFQTWDHSHQVKFTIRSNGGFDLKRIHTA